MHVSGTESVKCINYWLCMIFIEMYWNSQSLEHIYCYFSDGSRQGPVLVHTFGYPYSEQFGQHMQKDYGSLVSIASDTVKLRPWQCEQCGKTFTNSKNKKLHIEAIHRNVTYSCVCGKLYKYPRGLSRHQKDCDWINQGERGHGVTSACELD